MKKYIKAAESYPVTEEALVAALKRLNRAIDAKIRMGAGHIEIASGDGDYYQYYKFADLLDAVNTYNVDLNDTNAVFEAFDYCEPVEEFSVDWRGAEGEISEARSKYLGIKTKQEKRDEISDKLLADPAIKHVAEALVDFVLDVYGQAQCYPGENAQSYLSDVFNYINVAETAAGYELTADRYWKSGLIPFIGSKVQPYLSRSVVNSRVRKQLPELAADLGLSSLELKGGKFIFTL